MEFWLFLLALFAGAVDAIAGGGGLLTVPGLILAGLNPVQAIATNKLQAVFGSASASFYFWRQGLVKWSFVRMFGIMSFVGSLIGAWLLTQISSDWLARIIPIVLIAIALYLFSVNAKKLSLAGKQRVSKSTYQCSFAPIIGGYDGFFGPGAGTFFTLSNRWAFGHSILQATAQSKVLNFASNLAALLFFLFAGVIDWRIGLLMAVGQIIGGWLGARLANVLGARLIKPLLLIITVSMSIKLLMWP